MEQKGDSDEYARFLTADVVLDSLLEALQTNESSPQHSFATETLNICTNNSTDLVRNVRNQVQALLLLPKLQLRDLEGTSELDTDLFGSSHHTLGITKQELLDTLPSDQQLQLQGRLLLPLLEQQLREKGQWLSETVGYPGKWDEQGHLQFLETKLIANKNARDSLHKSWSGVALLLAAHVAQLRELGDLASQIVVEYKTAVLQEHDSAQLDKEVAHSQRLCHEVELLETQVKQLMYTAQTVPALKSVKAELDREWEQVTAKLQQVSTQLDQYVRHGQTFVDLANEYGALMEELKHAEFSLREFEKIQAELDGKQH